MAFGEQEDQGLAETFTQLFSVQITGASQGTDGTWYYDWTEVAPDPVTGAFADLGYGRSGSSTTGPFLTEVNNTAITPPTYGWARFRGIVGGQPAYEVTASSSMATIKCAQAVPQNARTWQRHVSDAVLNGTTTITSATAGFNSLVVGQKIKGIGIPTGTTIVSFSSGTSATMSNAATVTASSVVVTFGNGTYGAYIGIVDSWHDLLVGSSFGWLDNNTRIVSDGVTTLGSTTFTSATAAFTSADVGRVLIPAPTQGGYAIAAGTTIASVTNSTTVVMSAVATGTWTSVAVTIADWVWFAPTNPASAGQPIGIRGQLPFPNKRYQCRYIGADSSGRPIFTGEVEAEYQWMSVGNANADGSIGPIPAGLPTPFMIAGRQVKDAVINGTTTLTSATANFTSGDVGCLILGSTGIPGSGQAPPVTTIDSVTNSTTIEMTQTATGSATGVILDICTVYSFGVGQVTGQIFNGGGSQVGDTGWWTAGGNTGWMMPVNGESQLPVFAFSPTLSYVIGLSGIINGELFSVDKLYSCQYLGVDWQGIPIWGAVVEPTWWWIQVNSTSTSSVDLLGQNKTVTAYSCDILQVDGSGNPFDANGIFLTGWWYSGASSSIVSTPPGNAILTRQIDCDPNGLPVFCSGTPNTIPLLSGTPANSGSAGETGQVTASTSFLYICVAANTWRRVAISSF